MLLFITSYLAGMLTVLAPCILPILPIIIGGSLNAEKSRKGAYVIIGALSVSIVLFTMLLRASTVLISVPQAFWTTLSGGILIFFGLITLFPGLWDRISGVFGASSHTWLNAAGKQAGWRREVFLGMALGPVFTSCSPTYSLILATVLPASLLSGLFYTVVYALGLATILLLIALLGQSITNKLRVAANPKGLFKRSLGFIFLLVGLMITFGWDKDIEAFIIRQGYFGVTSLEETLVEKIRES